MDATMIMITVLSSVVCLFLGAYVNDGLRKRKAHDCPCDELIKVTVRVEGLEKSFDALGKVLHALEVSHNKLWNLVEGRLGRIETILEELKKNS